MKSGKTPILRLYIFLLAFKLVLHLHGKHRKCCRQIGSLECDGRKHLQVYGSEVPDGLYALAHDEVVAIAKLAEKNMVSLVKDIVKDL